MEQKVHQDARSPIKYEDYLVHRDKFRIFAPRLAVHRRDCLCMGVKSHRDSSLSTFFLSKQDKPYHIYIFYHYSLTFLQKSFENKNLFVYLHTVSRRNPELQMHKSGRAILFVASFAYILLT